MLQEGPWNDVDLRNERKPASEAWAPTIWSFREINSANHLKDPENAVFSAVPSVMTVTFVYFHHSHRSRPRTVGPRELSPDPGTKKRGANNTRVLFRHKGCSSLLHGNKNSHTVKADLAIIVSVHIVFSFLTFTTLLAYSAWLPVLKAPIGRASLGKLLVCCVFQSLDHVPWSPGCRQSSAWHSYPHLTSQVLGSQVCATTPSVSSDWDQTQGLLACWES